MKVISWNLLRLIGAAVGDVALLIEEQRPDLLLLQEATKEMEMLPSLVGGHLYRDPLPRPKAVPLPVSRMPGRVPPRIAQVLRASDITFANVHLSHGQVLNRLQLTRIARDLEGPAAVIGDYNAWGPTVLHGFRDVGPLEATHIQQNLLRFRLDRCLVRGLTCASARTLKKGKSDHRPIVLELGVA